MAVCEAESGARAQPNHVYVIPPNTLMSIAQGVLQLEPRPEDHHVPRPIDHFFRSLAADRKSLAIGVVLSGADSDGAMGLQAIRAEGGIAIVQSETSAKYADMPAAALRAGTVDLILSPEEIGREINGIGQHAAEFGRSSGDDHSEDRSDETLLNRVFALLHNGAGIDFRGYRRGTILRRIARRMVLHKCDGLEKYASLLESDRSELRALGEDLLINVTSFFRDPESFLTLENEVLPALLDGRSSDSPVRVWVPGCSSGPEVYSIAMCLVDATARLPSAVPIQIFGTDLSERCVAAARAGIYSESETAGFSPELLERFFRRVDRGYQIIQSIREMCVFARHNIFVDPPFSRLDLISCRNVLIYLEPALQRQVVATFHYALRPNGYLILGPAEGLRDLTDVFEVVNKEHRFYRRTADRAPLSLEMLGRGFANQPAKSLATAAGAGATSIEADVERTAQRIVLSDYAPAWVIVDENLDILHSRGDLAPYLQLPSGRASFSLLKMAREELRADLRKLMARMKKEEASVESHSVLRPDGSEPKRVRIEVRRIASAAPAPPCYLLVFIPDEERGSEILQPDPKRSQTERNSAEVSRLREELALTTQRLESIIAERDAANEDLTSANEEIRSSNEELQSINEELETSKEELQSSNEELNTVNEELENRNRELSRLSDDLENLLSSTTIPIVMLDGDLRIRRFTPAAQTLLNFRAADIGRPIGEIRTRLSVEDLGPVVRKVLETLTPEQIEVQDGEGHWHVLRVRPYRTADNRIEGAVLALIDIDQLRGAERAATAAREFAESVVDTLRTPLLVLRSDLRVRIANRAFYDCYGLSAADVEGRPLHDVPGGHWTVAGLTAALQRLAAAESSSEDIEIEQDLPKLGQRTVAVNARRIRAEGDTQVLVAAEDITAHKQVERILFEEQGRLKRTVQVSVEELKKTALSLKSESLGRTQAEAALHETEAALRRSREELRALAASLLNTQEEERRRVSRELHDDLSQKLAKLQFDVETLEQQLPAKVDNVKKGLLKVRDQAGSISNDVRRIAYQLHPSTLEHLGLSVALRSSVREFAEREGIDATFTPRRVPKNISPEIATSLYRIVQEALRNVAKHAGRTTVAVHLAGGANEVRLSVRDHGVGFDAEAVQGRGGLGLISMHERVRLIRGEFLVKTKPGSGVEITVRVPLS